MKLILTPTAIRLLATRPNQHGGARTRDPLARRRFAKRALTIATVLAVANVTLIACAHAARPESLARATATVADRPNILIILTDDQRIGTMDVMPATLRRFADQGATFPHAFATTPLCCPSRSSIFTGRFAHNHGVQSNARHAPDVLDQKTTVQRYLQDAGYRTALFGKYLNLWPVVDNPPHFDRWAITSPSHHSSGYYGGTWNVEGTARTVDRYSTDFIEEQGVRYISDQESTDGQPWFLELAVYAPHLRAVPEPAYADAPVPTFHPNPAIRESDRSDKPRYVRRSIPAAMRGIEATRRKQLRSLMSVDDLVATVFRTLAATGELDHTLAFFLSDNGFLWGEHGLRAKMHAYDPSIRVPFYMRWPGHVRSGSVDNRFVANIDIAPTILAAAGLPQDTATPMDGRSLLDPSWRRDRILTEYWRPNPADPPTWASLRTRRYHYIQYDRPDGTIAFREYYDLTNDPWELTNLLHDGKPANDPPLGAIQAQLAKDRTCAGAACP